MELQAIKHSIVAVHLRLPGELNKGKSSATEQRLSALHRGKQICSVVPKNDPPERSQASPAARSIIPLPQTAIGGLGLHVPSIVHMPPVQGALGVASFEHLPLRQENA